MVKKGAAMDEYRTAYRLAFDYHAKYAPFPQTVEAWEAAARDMAAFSTQGGNSEFLNALLLAIMDEFDRLWKAAQGK